MAGRPSLPIGSFGKITTRPNANGFTARTHIRDPDGVVRPVKRNGKSKAAAERALKVALTERQAPVQGSTITPETKFGKVAELWFGNLQQMVDAGSRSPGTVRTYRSVYNTHLVKRLTALHVREVTTPVVDAAIFAAKQKSAASARTAKVVIAGVMGLAVRHGAISINPVREVDRIDQKAKPRPRALSVEDRRRWFEAVESSERARAWDLPDLSLIMLATGARIGEALAVGRTEVDLDAATLRLDWHLVRVPGAGLQRLARTKTGDKDERAELPLPDWAVIMLRRRLDLLGDGVEAIFPDSRGSWRDPSNVARVWREVRDEIGMEHMVSHMMRKTVATVLDDANVSARKISDQLGHARVSMTQDRYLGRGLTDRQTADVLEGLFNKEPEQ